LRKEFFLIGLGEQEDASWRACGKGEARGGGGGEASRNEEKSVVGLKASCVGRRRKDQGLAYSCLSKKRWPPSGNRDGEGAKFPELERKQHGEETQFGIEEKRVNIDRQIRTGSRAQMIAREEGQGKKNGTARQKNPDQLGEREKIPNRIRKAKRKDAAKNKALQASLSEGEGLTGKGSKNLGGERGEERRKTCVHTRRLKVEMASAWGVGNHEEEGGAGMIAS